MKKLLVILCFLCTVITYAQSISVDRIESDGRHQIMTSTKGFKIGGEKYEFGLKIYEDGHDIDWLLIVGSFNPIPDNTIILIKLYNEEIIELSANNVHTGDVTTSSGYILNVGKVGYISPSTSSTYYSSVYVITPEDLARIDDYGIEKIRIGTDLKFVDEKWLYNQLGKPAPSPTSKAPPTSSTTTSWKPSPTATSTAPPTSAPQYYTWYKIFINMTMLLIRSVLIFLCITYLILG